MSQPTPNTSGLAALLPGSKVEAQKNLRETKREAAAAKKAAAPAAATEAAEHNPMPADVQDVEKEATVPAKKTPAKKTPAKSVAARVADTKASESKARAKGAKKGAATSRVAPVPQDSRTLDQKAPKLVWASKDGDDTLLAMGHKGGNSADDAGNPRYQYRVQEGSSGGFFASQRLAKGGKWTTLGGSGKGTSVEQAKRLAEFADAGAHWLAYTQQQALTHQQVTDTYGPKKAGK